MSFYQITSSEGVDMGLYQGSSVAGALDALARTAGYVDEADAAAVASPFAGTVVEVTLSELDRAMAWRANRLVK